MKESRTQEKIVSFDTMVPLLLEVLEKNGSAEITATGNSMVPMLCDRKSRVRFAKAGQLKRGDLPLYRRSNGDYVMHRVLNVEGDTYTCCGDGQWHLERNVRADQILAVVSDFTWGDRWVSCDSGWYRVYWNCWVLIRPVRRLVFGGLKRMRRIFGR